MGNNNWWLGLRYAEECRCQSVGGTGQASFVAPMDVSSVRSRRNEVVRTRCPSTFRKECNAGRNRWRWSFSERDVGFAQWNGGTGEPHANRCGRVKSCTEHWKKILLQFQRRARVLRHHVDKGRFQLGRLGMQSYGAVFFYFRSLFFARKF